MKSDLVSFKASLDKLAKLLTAAAIVILLIVVLIQFNAFWPEKKYPPIISAILLVLVVVLSYLFSPLSYSITGKELIIRRPVKSVYINRNKIDSVEQLDKEALKYSIRTFGVGGLFGYYGYFANQRLGKMLWYATRRDRAVLITTTAGKKIIVTPDDPESFVQRANQSSLN